MDVTIVIADILNAVFGVLFLIVAVWIAIFGGIGSLLARSRGGSIAVGLAWGTLLGPIGWLAILWTTRSTAHNDGEPESAATSLRSADQEAEKSESISDHDTGGRVI